MNRFSSTIGLAFALAACGSDSNDSVATGGGFGGDTDSGGFGTGEGQPPPAGPQPGGGNTNVNFGGEQDFGFVRGLIAQGIVPRAENYSDSGFFAEHQTPLPAPVCGERVCVQGMLGVMGNLLDGEPCVLLQVGLNSPVELTDDDVAPLSIAVVVDVSGSMQSDNKIGFTRQGLERLLNELNDDDEIAIIAYSTEAEVRAPLGQVRGRRNELLDVIGGLVPSGSTNLWAGMELGYQEILRGWTEGNNHRVILLSDGRPTVGVTNADEIVELSFPYNADGIGLTTIGLGTDFNQELMAGLAERADGNHYFIESGAALDEVFTEELAYFSVAVARDLELSVQIDPNFGIMRAYGAKTFDHTARQGTLDVASVFLAHRRSPDDVTDGDGRRGGGSALLLELMPMPNPDEPATTRVASLALEFTDPELGARVTDELTVEYPFPPSTVLQTGYFENEIVTKSFVMLNIFVGLQQSSDLFHQGRTDDAINMLRRLEAAVEDYNEEVQDTDIALDLEIIEDLRTLMQGLSAPPPPPEIPENPWPAD